MKEQMFFFLKDDIIVDFYLLFDVTFGMPHIIFGKYLCTYGNKPSLDW